VLSAATIQSEFGSNFQITGMADRGRQRAGLLLRSGALSAPMEFVEERVVGPQLGAENIAKGLHSTVWGFVAIAIFMIIYYQLFGFFSVLALACNLLFLLAILSTLQATLTLPGIAAIALALGMAIDANVLINERIREELRAGNTPQAAISAGFEPRLGHHFRLERDHPDRRPGAAGVRFGRGARLRRRALPGHPDLDVLGRVRLARRREPVVRPQERSSPRCHRHRLEPGIRRRAPSPRPRNKD
jgi:hypothetical protein